MKVILWFSVLLLVAAYICGPVIDPDLWWHITSGRWIIANGAVPQVDHWNMFSAGKPWRAYSWLVEIVFAFIDSNFGARGLFVLQLLIAVCIAFSVFYCFGRIAQDWFFGAVVGVWATLGCFNHFTLRPQSLVWIYFVWLIWAAERIDREGPSARRFATLFFLMVLWANTHLTAALAIMTVIGWLWRPGRERIAVQAALVCFVGSLVTPYLGGEWITFFSKTGHPFQHQDIAEFQSATIMQYSTAFLIIALVVLLTFLHFRPRSVALPKLAVMALFAAAGLAIVKFLPFAVIFAGAVVALIWHNERANRRVLGNLAEAIERLEAFVNKIPREGLSFVCICLAITYVVRPWRAPIDTDVVPVAAVDFMKENALPLPILNDFGRGGYLMYRYSDPAGNPGVLVPIDGRTNMVPPKIFEKFDAALAGKRKWREYFDAVKPGTVLWPSGSPLVALLLERQEWCLVYWTGDDEDGYSVFVNHEYWQTRQQELPSQNCSPAA